MPTLTLSELEQNDNFCRRHIGPDAAESKAMLATLGVSDLADLVDKAVPGAIRFEGPLNLPKPRNERDTLRWLRLMAGRNTVMNSMIGMGYYGTVMPKVVQRNVLESPGWYTAYTPYQAEVSQGRLEALLNFQQMVMDLTGFGLANASLLDEGTAAAEAMAMARRVAKSKQGAFFIDRDTHPQTIGVIETRARSLGIEIIVGDPFDDLDPKSVFAALLSYPASGGEVRDFSAITERLHGEDAIAIAATDLLALALLKPPGEWGADVAIGSAQRFGVSMGYGGPHAAFFATRESFKRAIPGRIIGVSEDSSGKPALRMALQTREQHIRRQKATSNICTAQVLLAVIAGFYAVWHGATGLRRIARRAHRMARIAAEALHRLGFDVETTAFFDTITVRVPGQARRIAAKAREQGINLRVRDADHLGLSLDETTRRRDLTRVINCFTTGAFDRWTIDELDREVAHVIPEPLVRRSEFLTHPVFHLYHSETEMLRYLRWLQSRDVALDRSMIPLGSCTMKLNATTEMIPVTWREFANMHPFAPLEQAQGYLQLFEELESWLAEITGFDAVSLQPNAGSQGEYSGLLTIASFHRSRGEGHRDVCLIPSSSHGTNPASSVLAGFRVVEVACDDEGNVDVGDLRAKVAQSGERLAALMITYPSTHGVYEEAITEICEIVHAGGGQVYLDGANLNALVGIARPGDFGADVCHINLHKTFCIPHGGGGPGAGPIAARQHLAPFLPDHVVVEGVNPAAGKGRTIGQVSAAPWGSASILPISWAYIAMMGADGLRRATEHAILAANYVARRLAPHYPILYASKDGWVAHECIIDLRKIEESSGITVEDVAKRLVDFGFHAPTMSFPVPGTLMIEPTESESKRELDRFCDAMIQIRAEIAAVEHGEAEGHNNLLVNAPHTHDLLLLDWCRPYSKAQAFFPLHALREFKYWPPVGRIDNVAGDRHLICTVPPLENYQEAAE